MKIAILGAGSLGTIAGAYIAAGGQDVELIDVYQAHVDALNQSGAKIIGTTDFQTKVKAITPDNMSGTYDLVLLLTKQLYNDSVLQNLLPFLDEKSVVLSLQNGIPEEKVASIVGRERVIAGSVEFGATFMEPGVSKLTTEFGHFKEYAFQIGELNGEITERIHEIKTILDLVGGTHISDNLVGTKWSKLLINNAFSGLSAALNTEFGGVIDHEVSIVSAAHIADETIKVGHANGVTFAKMNTFDIASLEIKSENDIPERVQTLRNFMEPSRLLRASMLQDLEKKRKSEIDYINGVVPRLAKGKGIATPYNDMVVKLVKQAEETQSVPNFDTNIKFFEELNK
ncbi:ketopantoate reductase family protein [Heyndrickxia sporothermodurans]|uniref:2-dehydropantoate 2-reductase n=1 Tax=Heyndrickxia sporothermodurans TaxID=46224 RepID=A0A150KZK1_9BACI|nr:ketopantoate reductase family protein [Heyndrickxia sporothermodurans]KYD05511.1 2-dehydropantoate 2-reductase [Heyndrickxia sporothermodurans]MBL5768302.1 ketopantoate reductase family protein [Heyndrickxia sporothermodurans]MBL5772535.1 ketopantoate reductase family protein [Heyndrickxia sporothermodurans]MBL5776036.1 ketopantoate reductase family protein [Heyndrickxia sporothermodurans]MBL5779682.1 ketopantoate reductase family protein [Heyndrickxia sporothermodurans]